MLSPFSAAAQYRKNTQKIRVIGADFILFSAQQDKIFAALELSKSRSPIQNNRKG